MNQNKFIDVPNLRIPASQKIAARLSAQTPNNNKKSKVEHRSKYTSIANSAIKTSDEDAPEVASASNIKIRPSKISAVVVTGCVYVSCALLFALCILAGFQAYFLSKVAGIDGDVLRVTKTETSTVTRTEWMASKTETTTKVVSVIASATGGVIESVALQPSQTGHTESLVEVRERGGKDGARTSTFTA